MNDKKVRSRGSWFSWFKKEKKKEECKEEEKKKDKPKE